MYCNTQLLESRNLSLLEYALLCLLRQNRTENSCPSQIKYLEENLTEAIIEKFRGLGLIEEVNRKNKAQMYSELLRTTKKGNNWLEDFETADVDEDSLKIYRWVESIYLNTDREIGNKRKTKAFIAQFTKESGISRNHLAFLIQTFINTESEFEWSKKLQFLFFKGDSVFSVKFDLESSRLYQFYQKNEQHFINEFKKIKN